MNGCIKVGKNVLLVKVQSSFEPNLRRVQRAEREHMIIGSVIKTRKQYQLTPAVNEPIRQELLPLGPASCARQGRSGLDQVGALVLGWGQLD
jgi:hypothetical protein